MAVAPRDPDAHLRRDLSHLVTFTVDDASTTEVDDAISVEQLPGGQGQKLWIHVADPTRWVAPGADMVGGGGRWVCSGSRGWWLVSP